MSAWSFVLLGVVSRFVVVICACINNMNVIIVVTWSTSARGLCVVLLGRLGDVSLVFSFKLCAELRDKALVNISFYKVDIKE